MREAQAVTTVINPPPSEIRLRVGATGGTITQVNFNVTAANAGNGTAIVGTPNPVVVIAEARQTGCLVKNATLTTTNPATLVGPSAIPYNQISWTTSDADIPAGAYLAGGGTQTLRVFPNCRRIQNNHTFRYANTAVYPPGNNLGTVTYTLAMP